MTKQITITLSDAEYKAFASVAVSPEEWSNNAVKERCRIAIEEIVQTTVKKCLETSTPIPSSKEEMVDLAFTKGWVATAEQLHKEALASANPIDQNA